MATETLHFYTTGPEFTTLIRNFIKEGNYSTAYEILKDGGMPQEYIKKFFLMLVEFKGSTQNGGDLSVVYSPKKEVDKLDLGSMLYVGIRTTLSENSYEHDTTFTIRDLHKITGKTKKNINTLYKVLGEDFVLKTITPKVLKAEGFSIINEPPQNLETIINGAILEDGTFVICGHQEHKDLYPLLYVLNYADASDWIYDSKTIHVTDNQICEGEGRYLSNLRYDFVNTKSIPKEMIDTLFKFRNVLREYSGMDETVTMILKESIDKIENYGGKYNGLVFLKRFYPEINLPLFSKTKIDTDKKQCIRTSPKFSLPGLLDSKFDIDDNSISEIHSTFEKYKNVVKDNVLHFFYQEFIEGKNGVCNYIDNKFNYSLSEIQGDIVNGKKGKSRLTNNQHKELKNIAKTLSTDFDQPIQLEFVTTEDKVYIVQFRILENNFEDVHILKKPNNIIASGKTFSKGHIRVDIKDVLIVQTDIDSVSTNLLGKKALIVRNDVQFSHALALSKALKIPSMYGIGNIELPKSGKINFVAYNKEAWITLD